MPVCTTRSLFHQNCIGFYSRTFIVHNILKVAMFPSFILPVPQLTVNQPSALRTGCHPGSEASVWLPGERNLCVRRGHLWSQPTECAQDRMPPRQRSICVATGRAKPVCAARPLVISANRVRSGQDATPAAKHLCGYRESETCVCGAATCDLSQPSALRTGCHPGSEASVWLPGERNLCVRRGHLWSQPTECAQDRMPPRQRSICVATGRAKPVCAARPLVISANRVRSGQDATPAAKHLCGYRESETCVCGAATCDLSQPSALRTGCHPGSEASVWLPGERNLCVRRGHLWSQPTECAQDRMPPRQRSICVATGRAKPVCAARPLVISANRVRSGQDATPAAKHLCGYRESETCVCGAATCDLSQPSALRTGCHPGSEASVWLPGERNLCAARPLVISANRVRSGQDATPAAKHLCGYRESETCVCGAATCDLSQPSALRTGCHPGSEASVWLPGERNLCVRRGHLWSQPTECAQDRMPPRQRSICVATGRAKPVCAARPLVISANRVRSGQDATSAAKHLWGYRESETCVCGAATCDLGHIMTNCRHFGQRPNRRNCGNGGSSRTMDERRCRHDMNEWSKP